MSEHVIDPEIDLALIFERDDVMAAFVELCCKTHLSDECVRDCEFCTRLRVVLAGAIVEWLGGLKALKGWR